MWVLVRLPEWLAGRVTVSIDGCWLWQLSVNSSGYGPHRRIYQKLCEVTLPATIDLDHLCRIRYCVNPSHLEPVSRKVNVARGQGHGSELICPQGHPYSADNTLVRRGRRECRICRREADRGRHDAAYWRQYRATKRIGLSVERVSP